MRRISVLIISSLIDVVALAEQTPTVAAGKLPPTSIVNIGQVVFTLLGILLIIIVCGLLIKRMSTLSLGGNATIKLLGGVNLGTKEKIILIEAGKKQLLIGVGQQINTLHVFDEPIVETSHQSEANNFLHALNKVMRKEK